MTLPAGKSEKAEYQKNPEPHRTQQDHMKIDLSRYLGAESRFYRGQFHPIAPVPRVCSDNIRQSNKFPSGHIKNSGKV
ncbi:hypothetical protein ES703_95969 [subsurface metagenome]